MIIYKDVLSRLASSGYTAYRIQKEKLISGSTLDRIRHNESITTEVLNTVCELCQCQPGELLQWIPDDDRERG